MQSKQHSHDSSHRKQQHRVAKLTPLVSHLSSLVHLDRRMELTKHQDIHGSSSPAAAAAGTASAAVGIYALICERSGDRKRSDATRLTSRTTTYRRRVLRVATLRWVALGRVAALRRVSNDNR